MIKIIYTGSFLKHAVSKVLLCAGLLAGLFARPLLAQEPAVSVKSDTSSILIGDQIGLTIEAEAENNYKIELPVLSDSLTSFIKIVRRIQADTILFGTRQRILHRYLITSFDSGLFEIPSLPFVLRHGAIADTLFSGSLFLAVNYPSTDTIRGIFDIKAPLRAPYTFMDFARIILPVLVFIIIVFLLIRYFRHRRKKQAANNLAGKPAEPAHVIALRELDRLKEEKLWQQGLIKEYYTRLTEIIRRYIEQRFNVPAMEQTSSEILLSLKGFSLEDDTLNALQELLLLADMVKFARELPLPDENESNMLNAYVFVNHTMERHDAVKVETINQNEDR